MELLLSAAALSAFYFVFRTIILQKKVDSLKKELVLSKYASVLDNKSAEEGFIKFLSDSREWAFDYITEVQNAAKKFIDKVDPEIKYFDQYGDVVHSVHSKSMSIISEAYKELVTILPYEEDKK
jgi:hypothetical protein